MKARLLAVGRYYNPEIHPVVQRAKARRVEADDASRMKALERMALALVRLRPLHDGEWAIPIPGSISYDLCGLAYAHRSVKALVADYGGVSHNVLPKDQRPPIDIDVDPAAFSEEPRKILVVDDVAATGAHLKAAWLVVKRTWPEVEVSMVVYASDLGSPWIEVS